MAKNATDLTEQVFGRLSVLHRAENSKHGAARWAVRCLCGVEKVVRTDQLTTGSTVSCGCYLREVTRSRTTTHGMTKSFEYGVWSAMKKRCTNPKHPRYHRYGGRGISVCKRWEKFEKFFLDMGVCPIKNGSIERVNNDKNYMPSNCIWIPKSEQSKNRNFNRGTIMAQDTSKRDYKKEYAEYHGKPAQIANRAERVKARRIMEKTGAATKGDGLDVDHIKPLKNGGTSAKSNLRMRSVAKNRASSK